MNMKMVVPVALGALVLASPALGQDAEKACDTLGKQFDRIDPHHPGANPTDEEARRIRKEGGDLCAAGKYAEGAEKIREALAKWGVTPHA